ncbi:sensor histidine kinase [Dyadobacter bucti]|uniref:sensor histidine kinase n=1 Tax=Dyadobacter bucti TaxID=2572203 RepID=UPI003F6E68E4
MKQEKSKSGVMFAVHLLAWTLLGFVLMFYQPLSWGVSLPVSFWLKQCLNFGILAGLFYCNALYVVPNFLLKNKVFVFILWIVGSVALLLVISKFVDHQLHVRAHMEMVMPRHGPRPRPHGHIDGILLMTALLVLGVSTTLTVIQRWQTDARLRDAVEKQNITSELALLKAQINPHFFFNTLNNIYALSYTDVPVSRDAILKLSRMMRYLLYETQQDTSLLSQEISFVKDYIELMKLRLQRSSNVFFREPQTEREYSIAPMLLLPFIENAFKHGMDASQTAEIRIELQVQNSVLTLKTFNRIFQDKNNTGMDSGGIGLTNTQRRLNLLYPEQHKLVSTENKTENTYEVMLSINLS